MNQITKKTPIAPWNNFGKCMKYVQNRWNKLPKLCKNYEWCQSGCVRRMSVWLPCNFCHGLGNLDVLADDASRHNPIRDPFSPRGSIFLPQTSQRKELAISWWSRIHFQIASPFADPKIPKKFQGLVKSQKSELRGSCSRVLNAIFHKQKHMYKIWISLGAMRKGEGGKKGGVTNIRRNRVHIAPFTTFIPHFES